MNSKRSNENTRTDVRAILEGLISGHLSLSEAEKELRIFSISHVEKDIAKLDPMRKLRTGIPELVLASGKTYYDLVKIVGTILSNSDYVLVTKIHFADMCKLRKEMKKKNLVTESGRNSSCLFIARKKYKQMRTGGKVGILCAGTSDIGIAEEARLISQVMGCETFTDYDVGIAGIHRTVYAVKKMIRCGVHVIVVAAGMEGALASVVSSLVDIPVIGVPTSVGYGFGSKGMAALSSMLQTCTLGVAVVNIDNGIGAGAFAAQIANAIQTKKVSLRHD
ncbi:MAG TPA: nickel pincer cofactor biosynthesis protein LarB [Nitrososphaeraceae archaeon]|nr:nickel pincer cofactor biosynthesis protein LarB [Nitrososphaeraceae archaeon]